MRNANQANQSKSGRIARLTLSALLALSLTGAPLAAFGDDEASDDGASQATEATTVQHGLYASANQTVHSNEAAVSTTADVACGLYAEGDAIIIANALTVQTQGSQSAAVATSGNGGTISIANSELSTAGADSPLLFSTGVLEADNVTGTAATSPLACIQEQGRIVIAGSSFVSAYAGSKGDSPAANAISLYHTEAIDTTSSQSAAALFQASGSKLESAIESGSFFYLTNTTAAIVLSDTDVSYDTDKAKLLVACGSDTTSTLVPTAGTATTYGTAGKNGATATFTALDQKLEGDIEVDSISSLDLFLLDGSTWTGAASITSNSSGADLASNIVVNVDATSGWTVTADSTVSTLNIEKGGSLVDANGKSVTIVDSDGNKLVDGASNVKVTVTDEFSTTVKTTDANKLQPSIVDRTAFDEEYGTSTTFGTNGADATASDEERAAALQTIITEWFMNLK